MGMLDGRVVIVTGGGRGLGRSHCLELARQGATVVVNDLGTSVEGGPDTTSCAEEVAGEIGDMGGLARASAVSVADNAAVEALVTKTTEEFGRLDAVVNNAGVMRDKMITGMSEDDFDQVIAVHLKGTWVLTRHACAFWRSRAKAGETVHGRIVNTTSGTGLFGNVGQANYGAAKAGIANLTIISAMEMQRYGVTANAISPIARTRMTELLPAMQSGAPEGWDPYDPGNASPVVAWLASEESGWLTGAILRVDGSRVQRMRSWEIDPVVQYASPTGERLNAAELDGGLRAAFGISPSGMPSGSITS
jgi:NAD(P)-dependent dehydrogenase (short-subunit alcohol dehydrogenase family)